MPLFASHEMSSLDATQSPRAKATRGGAGETSQPQAISMDLPSNGPSGRLLTRTLWRRRTTGRTGAPAGDDADDGLRDAPFGGAPLTQDGAFALAYAGVIDITPPQAMRAAGNGSADLERNARDAAQGDGGALAGAGRTRDASPTTVASSAAGQADISGDASGAAGASISVVNPPPPNNRDIDGILWGWKWNATSFTYSFPSGTAQHTAHAAINGFEAFNAARQDAVRRIFGNIASFTGLSFTEATNTGATLRFAEANSINYSNDSSVITYTGLQTIGAAEANLRRLGYDWAAPYSADYAQGDSWCGHTSYDGPALGSFAYATGSMNETGHNLGLRHGHNAQDTHGYTFPHAPL
jgi:hypothetical protein